MVFVESEVGTVGLVSTGSAAGQQGKILNKGKYKRKKTRKIRKIERKHLEIIRPPRKNKEI